MLALTGEDGFTIRAPSRPAATAGSRPMAAHIRPGHSTPRCSSAGRSRWRLARPAPRSASRTSVTDPRGNRTDFCYDVNYAGAAITGSRGNLARTIGPPPASSANRPVTLLAYDAKNNVTKGGRAEGRPVGRDRDLRYEPVGDLVGLCHRLRLRRLGRPPPVRPSRLTWRLTGSHRPACYPISSGTLQGAVAESTVTSCGVNQIYTRSAARRILAPLSASAVCRFRKR